MGWHHGYLGIGFLIAYVIFWKWWLFLIGGILVLDELSQVFIFGQYKGVLHWIYIKTFYKINIIKKFNLFLDNLFGKNT